MKVLSIIAAVALASSSAMAVETVVGVKGRFDYVRTENKNKTTNVKTKSGEMTTSFLRLVTDSKINDTVSVKLTLDFAPVDTSTATRADSGVSQMVDEAFLTKDFGHGIKAMVGKHAIMTGGRENDYSSRDLYFTSEYKRVTPENLTGLSLGYSMAGQNVYVQYLEQKASDSSTPSFTDKKVLGAAYYGSFMDGMIAPIVSYHKYGTNRLGAYNIATSAGLRLVPMKAILIEADWLQMEQEKNGTAVAGASNKDAKLTSVVAHVRYMHENFQPFFKYIMDKGTNSYSGIPGAAAGEKTKRNAWELGLEYVPNKDEDMRYHVVYNSATSEKETPSPVAKVEEKKIYAGIAFNYNILK